MAAEKFSYLKKKQREGVTIRRNKVRKTAAQARDGRYGERFYLEKKTENKKLGA